MASQDLHNQILQGVALNIAAIGSDTTTDGVIIDTQGFESVEFLIQSGTLTDGTYTPQLQDGDDSGLSDAAVVTSDFLLGTVADATFALTDDDAAKRIGYVGKKRYVRLSIVSTVVTTGGTLGAIAIKSNPRNAPTDAA